MEDMCTGPRERARECLATAINLVKRAKNIINERKDMAAEMLWDAVSLAVKAYIYATEGRRIETDEELWSLKNHLADKLGDIALDVFQRAAGLHQCATEKVCTHRDVEVAAEAATKLIYKIKNFLNY